jgi:hypothetical protein
MQTRHAGEEKKITKTFKMDINFPDQIALKSNKELVEIYTNDLEFQPEFVELARLEIIRRNIPLDALEELKERKEAIETETLVIGKQGNPVYLTLIGLAAFFGGVPAIIGGYIYAYSAHSNSNGDKYFVYNDTARKWGQIIFYIGVAVFFVTLITKFIN